MTMPRSATLARILILINGLVWIVLAVVGMARAGDVSSTMLVVYILALVDACVLFFLARRLGSRSRWIYFMALAVIAVNALLSITDQLGWTDIAVLCLNLVTLALLLAARSYYLSPKE